MRSTILILFVALMATSCTKPTTPNPIKTTSVIEFDFNGKHYKQTINKDGNEESGNKGTHEVAYKMTTVESNSGSDWSIVLKSDDDNARPTMVMTMDGGGWINIGLSTIPRITVSLTRKNQQISGTFSGKVQSGAVIKEITNGVITDVPYVNL